MYTEGDNNQSMERRYKWIESFVYDPYLRYPGMFILPGIIGMGLSATAGMVLLIVDIFLGWCKYIPIILIFVNIILGLTVYNMFSRKNKAGSYTFSFFKPSLMIGLCGVYSSLLFLYLIYEMFYWTIGPQLIVNYYMIGVIIVYVLIAILQGIWYLTALKKGYYCMDESIKDLDIVRKKMNKVGKILVLPPLIAYASLGPGWYPLSRLIVHTIDSYPLQIFIYATLLVMVPFVLELSLPVLLWWYMVKKYRKFIPENRINSDQRQVTGNILKKDKKRHRQK